MPPCRRHVEPARNDVVLEKMEKNPADILSLSREWGTYMVKATFSEEQARSSGAPWPAMSDEEALAHGELLKSGLECQIVVLPTPILIKKSDVRNVITIRRAEKIIRVYPPFPLNETGETAGGFKDVQVPVGDIEVRGYQDIPSEAVKGARMVHSLGPDVIWCRGLRVDVQSGADRVDTLRLLLDHVCQYTHQWWLRGNHNPFLGSIRLGAAIAPDFSLLTPLRREGAGEVESTWYSAVSYQPNLGCGTPLTNGTWLLASHHVTEGRSADTGILGFHDALADYMAGRDDRCILNLGIAVEIMLSKARQTANPNAPNLRLEKLIKTSPIVDQSTKEILRKLAIDRDHVAHGRGPYILASDANDSIEGYLNAGRNVLSAYLEYIPTGSWPHIMVTEPPRPRR